MLPPLLRLHLFLRDVHPLLLTGHSLTTDSPLPSSPPTGPGAPPVVLPAPWPWPPLLQGHGQDLVSGHDFPPRLWVSPRTGAACLVHLFLGSPYHRWTYRQPWKHEFFTYHMAKGCRFICSFGLCNLVPEWESASLCKMPLLHLGRWYHLKLTPSCDNGRTPIKAETLSSRTSSPTELWVVSLLSGLLLSSIFLHSVFDLPVLVASTPHPTRHPSTYTCLCMDQISTGFSLTLTSLVAHTVKHLPIMRDTWAWSLDREDPLEKEMATHSSILDWKISWTEELGRLQSLESQRDGHNWATSLFPFQHNCSHNGLLLHARHWSLSFMCNDSVNPQNDPVSKCSSVVIRLLQRNRTNRILYILLRERERKELAHTMVGTGKANFCRVRPQARDPGNIWHCRLSLKALCWQRPLFLKEISLSKSSPA